MLSHGNLLRVEYGRALACNERSLFFGTASKPKTSLGGQLGTQSTRKKSTGPFALINALYSDAGSTLLNRLEVVTEDYFVLEKELKNRGIIIADRGEQFIQQSRAKVSQNFRDLETETDEIAVRLASHSAKFRRLAYCQNWVGLNNMCHLFMDEISYLSSRIDDFHNLISAHDSSKASVASLNAAHSAVKWAKITLVATVALALFSPLMSKLSNDVAEANKTNKMALDALEARVNSLADIQNKMNQKQEAGPQIHTVPDINIVAPEMPGKLVQSAEVLFQALTKHIELKSKDQDNGGHDHDAKQLALSLASGNKPVVDKLEEVKTLIDSLRTSVLKKNFSPVIIHQAPPAPPSQEPAKRFGIFTIDIGKR